MKFKPNDIAIYFVASYGQPNRQEYIVKVTKVWTSHYFARKPFYLFEGIILGFNRHCENGFLNKFQTVTDSCEHLEFKADPNQILKDLLNE